MQPKATWQTSLLKLSFYLAIPAVLPFAFPATLLAQPPQSRFPAGFPGNRTPPNYPRGNPNQNQTPQQQAPTPTPTPTPAPTPAPASQLPPMPPPAPPAPTTASQKPAQRASVQFENGLLTVKAYNSSLNQILRAIMHATGLQITGGVNEERVYGVYGPAPLQALLRHLLDGTGSNILYMPANASKPAQLTLTPRGGGAAPPPPSATASDDLLPDAPVDAAQTPPPAASPTPAPQPASPVAVQPAVPAVTTPAATTNTATPATGQPTFPPKAHTPEELVQQILQLRAAQQKMQQDAAPPAKTPTPAPKK